MSDVSVLTYEYDRDSDLSQTINRALIDLKKARYQATSPQGDEESGDRIADIVDTLVTLLQPLEGRRIDGASAARIPAALVARVRARHQGDLVYYLEDLARVARLLRAHPPPLSGRDLALLDDLATVADAETSRVFRRLMRA